jgi:hypothetical protein
MAGGRLTGWPTSQISLYAQLKIVSSRRFVYLIWRFFINFETIPSYEISRDDTFSVNNRQEEKNAADFGPQLRETQRHGRLVTTSYTGGPAPRQVTVTVFVVSSVLPGKYCDSALQGDQGHLPLHYLTNIQNLMTHESLILKNRL